MVPYHSVFPRLRKSLIRTRTSWCINSCVLVRQGRGKTKRTENVAEAIGVHHPCTSRRNVGTDTPRISDAAQHSKAAQMANYAGQGFAMERRTANQPSRCGIAENAKNPSIY